MYARNRLKPPPTPLLYKITGRSGDGLVATLGKYRTREEADADHARFVREAYYRDLEIREIPQPPPVAAPPAG